MERYSGSSPDATNVLQQEPVCETKKLTPEEIQKVLDKFDFDRYLGGGSYGIAFLLKDHTVLKITCDETEAKASSFLVGKRLENVAEVYEVYRLPSGKHAIIMEYIPDSLADDDNFGEYLRQVILKVLSTPGVSKKEKMILAVEFLREEPFNENSDMSNGVSFALEALEKAGIVWLDFHNGNMGMKGGRIKVFDIGQSQSPGGMIKTLSKNERYSGLKIALISKPRNLITHYDDTLLAMAELEGEGWLDHQLHTAPDREYDVPHAVVLVKKRQQDAKEWAPDPEYPNDKPPDLRDTVGDAIYGAGGWHRYFIRGTGNVIFSGMHASPENRKKAKELGFEVW